jgi:aspartokinase/homoserine dehydrogenase 1
VRIPETNERIRKAIVNFEGVYVTAGSIGADEKGITTNLGRKGSDFTATLLGAALDASEIEIWTDRDGIYNADPQLVPEASVIKRMTYEEAQEMAYFGADMIHSQALQPALEKNIPVTIRNIFNEELPGTRIGKGNGSDANPVQAITTIDGVGLVNLEGSGMTGVPGIAGRLFSALAEQNVDIVMISQASSEHSICFVVPPGELEAAVEASYRTFQVELNAGLIQRIEKMDQLVALSVIGSKMRGTPGISAKFFRALGSRGINILIISQGSSERNISIVISNEDKREALRAVHEAFFTDTPGVEKNTMKGNKESN